MAKRLRAMALADIAAGRDPGRKRHYIDVVDDEGRWTGKVVPVPEALRDPLGWKKPQMVFVNSMSDLFHESLPFEFIDQVLAVMNATGITLPAGPKSNVWHTYQVLTKRHDRMLEYLRSRDTKLFKQGQHPLFEAGRGDSGCLRGMNDGGHVMNAGAILVWPLPNVIVGVSVEDQKRGDQRWDAICELGEAGWRTMVSLEPLLGPVVIPERYLRLGNRAWCVVGGESGHDSRPCDVGWIRAIVRQCEGRCLCFVKQIGSEPNEGGSRPLLATGGGSWHYVDRPKDKKGGDMAEWPDDLRVRQMPAAT